MLLPTYGFREGEPADAKIFGVVVGVANLVVVLTCVVPPPKI